MSLRPVAAAPCLSACAAATVAPGLRTRCRGHCDREFALGIDFGRSRAGVIAAISRLEGDGPAATAACPDGGMAVGWPGGLALHFRDGAFLGGAKADRSAAGIAC